MKKGFAIAPVVLLALALLPARLPAAQNPISAKGQERISEAVRHELVMLPFYTVFDNLEYKVDGGVVTLSGQVTHPTLKADAEKVAQRIEGVDRVVNQIEVLPLSRADDWLRLAAYRTVYAGNNVLSRYGWSTIPPIHIIVKNGNVTLVGVVDNATDKNVATLLARTVPGVFSVTNELTVKKA